MPPDPPREQGPPGLATPTQINATPTSKTVENPDTVVIGNVYDIMQIRGSFSYILLLLELRRSFVIPNYRGLRYKEVRYIKVPLYFVLQI